jgi:hypothetical protein
MTGIYEPEQDAGNVEIKDPDDLHRIRRVEAIHDARERFVKVRLRARDMMYDDPNWSQFNVDRYAIMTWFADPTASCSSIPSPSHRSDLPRKPFQRTGIPAG